MLLLLTIEYKCVYIYCLGFYIYIYIEKIFIQNRITCNFFVSNKILISYYRFIFYNSRFFLKKDS